MMKRKSFSLSLSFSLFIIVFSSSYKIKSALILNKIPLTLTKGSTEKFIMIIHHLNLSNKRFSRNRIFKDEKNLLLSFKMIFDENIPIVISVWLS